MNANPQKARELFLAAVKLTSDEWDAFLDGACNGDHDLRLRVSNLLRAHGEIGSFLEGPVTGTTFNERTHERPGAVIGPYKLLEQIGEGGFGVVFMAEQMQPVRRKVALKVLKPGMDTRQVVARFEAERQALAIMDHPNIAKVLDAGATPSGRPYFVMDLVKGVPITDFCDQHQLTPRERLELFITVCEAVQHAHQKGIIHRDLKPSNVLVTMHDTTPVPKVIDFGVAKALGQELTDKTLFTGFAEMLGTPLYMSPEQAGQSGLDVDTRSDIYSLGVLLYELLTGTTPFDKERFKKAAYDEIRRIIREEDPPRPSTRLSASKATLPSISAQRQTEPAKLTKLLRGELDWIVMKALEKDRNRRYDTANSLALDVQRYLSDEPVQACPPSAAYRLRKLVQRHKTAFTAAALIAAVLVIGSGVSIWQAIRATGAERLAEQRLGAETTERGRAVLAERSAQERLFKATLEQARASRRSREVGQLSKSWEALIEAARMARELNLGADRLVELRDEAIACLALTDVRQVKKWGGWPPGSTSGFAFDARLERYARSDHQGNISVRRVEDDQQLAPPLSSDVGAAYMTFSPDSTLLAVLSFAETSGQANFRLWDWRSRRLILEPSAGVPGHAFAFSPDGKQLALGQADGTLIFHDAVSGAEEKRLKLDWPPGHLAFHPTGRQLAVASFRNGQIHILDLPSGKPVRKFTAPGRAWSMAWHPDGVVLATSHGNYNAYLWDSTTGGQFAVLQGHQGSVGRLSFSPDGGTLLTGAWDGTCRVWDTWSGLELLRIAGGDPCFGRDGRLASRAGYNLVIWELVCGREYATLPRSPASMREKVTSGGFSADNQWLAVSTEAGVRLWDLSAWREIGLLPLGRTHDVKFHAGRAELFTSGPWGVCAWPLQTQAQALRIGPPQKLSAPGPAGQLGLDRAGGILAAVDRQGGWIVDLQNRGGKPARFSHLNAQGVAIAGNGRWLATGTQHGYGVKVWDAAGKLERHLLPQERWAALAASPNGRWLATTTEAAVTLWDAETWQAAHVLPREHDADMSTVFSPDSRMVAVPASYTAVALIEAHSGRVLARLQAPDADLVSPRGFSPDGSQLLVSTRGGHLRVWDLRLIRARLEELGLDRDFPTYAAAPRPAEAKPIRLDVDLGDFGRLLEVQQHRERARTHAQARKWADVVDAQSKVIELQPDNLYAWQQRGRARCRLGQWDTGLVDLARAVELATDDPRMLNSLAWALVVCPEGSLRDPARAVRLAKKAVELAPQEGEYWNTLGVAEYRAVHFTSALASLQRSSELRKGGDSWDWFVVAMCHWRLGRHDEARRWHDRAVAWMAKHRPDEDELIGFHAEAAELLGIQGP